MEYLKKYWWALLLVVILLGLWWYMSMKKKTTAEQVPNQGGGNKTLSAEEAAVLKQQFSGDLAKRVLDFGAKTGYYAPDTKGGTSVDNPEYKKIDERMKAWNITAEQAILLDLVYMNDLQRKKDGKPVLDYTKLYELYNIPKGMYTEV